MKFFHPGNKLTKGSSNKTVGGEAVFFLFFAFFSLKVLTSMSSIRLFYAASWPDPFIYTGYAINYSGLLHRYGGTYYGARISTILPTWSREKLDVSGQDFRLFLLSVFALGFYLAFRIYAERIQAGLYALAATYSILFLRYVSDDYAPGFVSLYSLITIVALLRSSSTENERKYWIMLSGAAAGLAFNSNITIIIILAPWIFTFLWSQNALHPGNKFAELRTIVMSAVFSQTICILIGIYFGGTASLSNYKATLGAIRNLRLYESLFSRPISQVSSFVLLFVCLTLLVLLIVLKEAHQHLTELSLKEFRQQKLIYSTGVSALVTLLAGFAYHFLISNSWFTTSFYAFLYYPPVILTIYIWLVKKSPNKALPIVSIVLTSLIFHNAHKLSAWKMIDVSNLRLLLVSMFMLFILVAGIKRIRFTFKLFTIYVLIFSSTFMLTQDWNPYWATRSENKFDGEFSGFMNKENQKVNESTQYFAEDFASYVKEVIPGTEYYWLLYPQNPSWLLSIDATQLWGYSCFECTDKNGYPIARDFPPKRSDLWPTLTTRRFSVLFSEDSKLQSDAVSQYLAAFPTTSIFDSITLSHLNRNLFVTIVINQ